ncbi:MAG: pyridoxine 5'-phosphate synthase [Deferrisomatales bacterium]
MPGGGVYYQGRFHLLYVHLDAIARLWQTQGGGGPDPVEAAVTCDRSGCDGISFHLREDRVPVAERELLAIKERIRGRLTLATDLSDRAISLVGKVNPHKVILEAAPAGQVGAATGRDPKADAVKIKEVVARVRGQGAVVSLCIEPDTDMVEIAAECGVDFVEINTSAYGRAKSQDESILAAGKVCAAATQAVTNGLKVSAGRGLNAENILPILKARALEEVYVGRSIIDRSFAIGLGKAVEEMLEALE